MNPDTKDIYKISRYQKTYEHMLQTQYQAKNPNFTLLIGYKP